MLKEPCIDEKPRINYKKVESAIKLIKEGLTKGKPCIAFSGGKDSTVVLHLVRSIAPQTLAEFNDTGVEARETYDFVRTIPNIVWIKYEKSFWQCVKEYGFPKLKGKASSHGNLCCKYLKERPSDKFVKEAGIDVMFLGTTAAESRQRFLTFKRTGALYQVKSGLWKCHPIWDWTEEEVWGYIKHHALKYNTLYDLGARRVGCQPCTAYLGWMENLARENPKLLSVVLRKQGQEQISNYLKPSCRESPRSKPERIIS